MKGKKTILAVLLFLTACSSGTAHSTNGNTAADSANELNTDTVVFDDNYNCDLEGDLASYDGHVDIVVGDNLYMTQVNDWFENNDDYAGKVAQIEGFYLLFDKYLFVGRNGPSCPYCTGGYVDFEFITNEDLSSLVHGESWIRVTGYIREGTMSYEGSDGTKPFYYIEAMKVEVLDEIGVNPIAN